MTIKQKILIIEALIVLVLASVNVTVTMETTEDYTIKASEEEIELAEDQEYTPSISEKVIHFETIFKEVSEKGWIVKNAGLMARPYPNSKAVATIVKYSTVTVTGYNDFGIARISYNGKTYYMNTTDITTDYQIYLDCIEGTYNSSWRYSCLTASRGTIQGPSGKETYYNLDMSGVIAIMRRLGNYDIYWIREDGVKMLGDYVMIAANLNIRPRGSLVETSLGIGIVCDTGGFALNNPYQIDIAVDW